MPLERRPRVVLADDFPPLLVALRRLLEPGCDVVGSSSSGHDAVATVMDLKPDVIVLDVRMHDLNGLEACRQIRQLSPDTSVILMTAADDADLRTRAFQVGASAFVAKGSVADELERTIQRVVARATNSSDGE
jgi:DNA-binding NarL/FixJ family response regulator